LQSTCACAATTANVGAPAVDLALADPGLRAVVDDDAQRRVPFDHAREPRQVARQHERVEDQAVREQRLEHRVVRGSREPVVVPMSCTIGRTPTSLRSRASAATCSGASPASKSTQPTTPATNGVRCATSSSQCVSASVGAACTRIVDAIPCRARIGARSVGPKSR
jgi:hypothetical protein